jgi:hypothetical protein
LLKDLVSRFYLEKSERVFRVRFLTPTSFKSAGEYVFFPQPRLVFGSLMRKYAAVSANSGEDDEETLQALTDSAKIVRYNLKSEYGTIGHVRLPAFCGMAVIKLSGPQPLINYAHFLLRFGEYSGVGIKTAALFVPPHYTIIHHTRVGQPITRQGKRCEGAPAGSGGAHYRQAAARGAGGKVYCGACRAG